MKTPEHAMTGVMEFISRGSAMEERATRWAAYDKALTLLSHEQNRDLLPWHPVASFEVFGRPLDPTPSAIVRLGPVAVKTTWTVG